jgi:hypothetical protein
MPGRNEEKNRKPVRVDGPLAKISTRDLTNMKQECYMLHQNIQLDVAFVTPIQTACQIHHNILHFTTITILHDPYKLQFLFM